jgi:adenine-specific DNA methylase
MVGKQPRLILNETDTTCTNAIHGLTWKKPLENKIQASLALSVFSSLGRLSAELVGRSYGGGVLKLEPREAARVVVSLPQAGFPNAREKLKQVDTLIRSGNFLEALRLADDIVLRDHLGLSSKDVSTFQEDVSYLERRRSGHKKSF